MKVRGTLLLCSAVIAVLAIPFEAAGQLRVIPRAGLYAPVTDPGTVSTIEGARDLGRREASFAWGGSVELGPSDGTSLRLNGLYGTDGEIPVAGIGCEGTACRGRSTLLTVTGTAVFRPLPSLALVQPYVLVGGGIKRYDFDFDDAEGVRAALEEGSRATGQLGIGVEWTLGVLRGVLEVSDFIGGAVMEEGGEGDTQHDLFLTLGLILG